MDYNSRGATRGEAGRGAARGGAGHDGRCSSRHCAQGTEGGRGGGEDGVTPPRLTSLPLLSGLKHDAISPSTAEQRQFGVFRT